MNMIACWLNPVAKVSQLPEPVEGRRALVESSGRTYEAVNGEWTDTGQEPIPLYLRGDLLDSDTEKLTLTVNEVRRLWQPARLIERRVQLAA